MQHTRRLVLLRLHERIWLKVRVHELRGCALISLTAGVRVKIGSGRLFLILATDRACGLFQASHHPKHLLPPAQKSEEVLF